MNTNVDSAFWYVDGIPTKGLWIDMSNIFSFDDVLNVLVDANLCQENYGGDLLVVNADDLAGPFASRYGSFDLKNYIACRDNPGDWGAKAAWARNMGSGDWSQSDFEDAYVGQGEDGDVAFVREHTEEGGWLEGIPDGVRMYIDWEAVARDRMIDTFWEDEGYYFYRG